MIYFFFLCYVLVLIEITSCQSSQISSLKIHLNKLSLFHLNFSICLLMDYSLHHVRVQKTLQKASDLFRESDSICDRPQNILFVKT